ncbi:hypothetical protein [Seonamhaeicola sp. ML3]|uniref:hypothetical protein n=1 Tax=Seonamhaeicola sp. ML3 TaxID=2937786 RepID=UPI00200D1A9F|nr:hypothetical protein [Seonamhaeicola sp. ML3]
MSKDNIDTLFKRLENEFDIEQPSTNHTERFLDKLNNKQSSITLKREIKKQRSFWKPFLSIAASILLLVTFTVNLKAENERDLASVSPKMAETQDFFLVSINEELDKLKDEQSPETKKLIQDAMKRIEVLENEYESLKTDLIESGDDNRVIYAMISNFQNRIDVLKNTLEQVNIIKEFKNQSHETKNTI